MTEGEFIPELSVIVPVYNTGEFLCEALDSLLNQTFTDLEIILINDGSQDNSGEICDEYAKKDFRVKVLHKKNEGQGVARNIGINLSKGKYLTFLDSDDFIDLRTYEYLLDSTKKYGLDINRFCYTQFCDTRKIIPNATYSEPVVYSAPEEIRQAALCIFSRPVIESEKDLNLGGSACCAIFKRSLIVDNDIKFPSNKEFVCEDLIFNYHCLLHANRVGKSQSVLYYYRINPISTTHKPNTEVVKKCVRTCKYLEKCFIDDGYPLNKISYAKGFVVETIRSYLKNVFMSDMNFLDKIRWATEQAKLDYIKEVKQTYAWKNMSFKHKLYFWLFVNRCVVLLYVLVVGQEKIRLLKN